MGWFENRMMRGATNRAGERLAAEFGMGPATGVLAIALGHACYPDAKYGDNGAQDEIVAVLKRFHVKPSDAGTSCKNIELWLDRNAISTVDVFQRTWGLDPDTFLQQFFEFMDPDDNSQT